MPLPEEQKSTTPFKNMDIKTLFMSANSRKRKASSPIPALNEAKNVKIESDDDVKVLEPTNVISARDSKENKDLNTLKNEHEQVSFTSDTKKVYSSQVSCEEASDKESLDELNSSISGLNTSAISEGNLDAAEVNKNSSNAESGKSESVKPVNSVNKENVSKKRKRMTPEEAKQRAEEREKKQQERLLKKQELETKKREREQELLQKKLQKEYEKQMKEEEKKEKEKQRLEKKEQEEKEKQMKAEERESQKKVRQMMLESKLERKKQKEELKQKQEEERKKAEEEKKKADLEKEHKEKEKKERAKAAFMKFFVTDNSAPPSPAQKPVEHEGAFKPFQISEDMTLAPVVPFISQERFNRQVLDAALKSQCDKELYLTILKSGSYSDVRRRKKLRKSKLSDADVLIMDKKDEVALDLRAKLLQFCENVRPPYWGTWRKKSSIITPRNPFREDTNIFDYEVDSEEEWDEGGPGESLSGTEQEDESEDDYEVDNEFFVPHGYLSAEEEKEEDEEENEKEKDGVINDPEKQKALLKKKLQEFEMERKKKTTELKPILIGCYVENGQTQNRELRTFLESYAAVLLTENPIPTSFSVKLNSESKTNSTASSPTSSANNANKSKKSGVPEEAMPHLIRLINGNPRSMTFLIADFQKFWQQHCLSNTSRDAGAATNNSSVPGSPAVAASVDSIISKRQLNITFRQIATFRKAETSKKAAWWVNEGIIEKYGLKNEFNSLHKNL